MKALFLIVTAAICLSATEPRVSRASLTAFEAICNDRFRTATPDSYDLLGTARGSYLEGYGALFTIELNLIYVPTINPFRPTVSAAEIASIHERKVKKLQVLTETMHDLMLNASGSLQGLPANEHIAIEAFLWSYNWENTTGVPRRLLMSAEKQKLLDAKNRHASGSELASIIREQEL